MRGGGDDCKESNSIKPPPPPGIRRRRSPTHSLQRVVGAPWRGLRITQRKEIFFKKERGGESKGGPIAALKAQRRGNNRGRAAFPSYPKSCKQNPHKRCYARTPQHTPKADGVQAKKGGLFKKRIRDGLLLVVTPALLLPLLAPSRVESHVATLESRCVIGEASRVLFAIQADFSPGLKFFAGSLEGASRLCREGVEKE